MRRQLKERWLTHLTKLVNSGWGTMSQETRDRSHQEISQLHSRFWNTGSCFVSQWDLLTFCNVQRHPCWKVLEAFENKEVAPCGLSVWLQFPQKQAQVNIKGLASEGLDLLCVCLGTFPWFCIFGVNFPLRNWLQVQRGQVWGQEWVESPSLERWNCRELDTHLTSPFFGPTC